MYLNYIYANDVDVFLDSLQQVSQVNMREMKTYQPYLSKNTKSMPIHVMPTEYTLSGKFVSGFMNFPSGFLMNFPIGFPMNFPSGFPSSTAADLFERKQKIEYMGTFDDDVLLCLGSEARAMYGHIVSFNGNHTSQNPVSNTFSLQFIPTFPIAQGEVYEAENINHNGTESSDSDSSGDKCVQIDTQYNQVLITLTQSAYRLPEGKYKLFVRAKDDNQVADDLKLEMYNQTDSTSIGSTTKTLTADYALYESGTITVAADDVGDTIRIVAEKATGTTNTISIDFIGFARV
jgi:hypothetical protein